MANTTRRGMRTRAEILDAARFHMLVAGPDKFSLREVARRARLSPAALYNHYPSREALIHELGMEAMWVLAVSVSESRRESSPRARLYAFAEGYLRFAREEPERYQLVLSMLTGSPDAWDELAQVARPFDLIVEACRDGLTTGSLKDPSDLGPAGIAYGLWALVHGMVVLSAHHVGGLEEALLPMQRTAIDAYLEGISGHGPGRSSSATMPA